MVGGCCVVVLVLVVNHTLWLCLCGGVGCGDHEWWHLAPHQVMQVPIVLPCFCGGVHLFFCATISPSSFFLLLLVVEGVVVGFDEASVGD